MKQISNDEHNHIIELSGQISVEQASETHCFAVPDYVKAMHISVEIGEGSTKPTFQWNDPIRSRGFVFPDHGWGKRFDVYLSRDDATRGLRTGPIVSGNWTLYVSSLQIKEAITYSVRISFLREPNVRGYKWYAGDFHTHTNHSDGVYSIWETIHMAKEDGLQFLCITDHNTTSGLDELGETFNSNHTGDFLVMRGMEFTSSRGHANGLGLKTMVDWRVDGITRTFRDVAADTRTSEGLFSINHPYHALKPHSWWEWDMDFSLVDCMEIWNSLGVYRQEGKEEEAALAKWDELLKQGHLITGIGGSDSVHAGKPSDHKPGNPVTYVFAEKLTEDDIMKGVKEGRVIVSKGPLLDVKVRCGDQWYRVGDRIRLHHEHAVVFQVGIPFSQAHVTQVVKNGEIVLEHTADAPISTEWVIDVQAGDWIRTQVWDSEKKLLAFTNPVYIV
jgi:hypothetical protein